MPKWNFHGRIDDDFEFDEDFDVAESYTGFEKIGGKKGKSEEEVRNTKKKSSVKHQKRPDKD
jgi:hypothetical protein